MHIYIYIYICVITSASKHVGSGEGENEFVLGFIENTRHNRRLVLTLSADEDTDFSISVPGFNFSASGLLTASEPTHYQLSGEFYYEGDLDILSRAIYVRARSSISVICTSQSQDSTGSYQAVPVEELGDHYIAVSYEETDTSNSEIESGYQRSALAVFAVEDNTDVNITFSLAHGGSCGGGEVWNGETRRFTVNKHESVGTRCSSDLTGTVVRSSGKVAVVSGNICTQVPREEGRCDHLVEMMRPKKYFAKSYVVADLSNGNNDRTIYRIIAADGKTRIRTSTGNRIKIRSLEFATFDTSKTGPFCFTSNRDVFVVLFIKTSRQHNVSGHSFMSIVPATTQYSSKYVIDGRVFSQHDSASTFVAVIIRTYDTHLLSPAVFDTFRVLDCCNYAVATAEVTASSKRHLRHKTRKQFGVFTYSYIHNDTNSFLAGITFKGR